MIAVERVGPNFSGLQHPGEPPKLLERRSSDPLANAVWLHEGAVLWMRQDPDKGRCSHALRFVQVRVSTHLLLHRPYDTP